MGYTALNRERLTFNEGGRFFTLFWRWATSKAGRPRFFRVYLLGWSFCTLRKAH